MRAINLNRELACEYLCQQIQLLINEHKEHNPNAQECVLIMDIKQIIDSSPVFSVPLIEHQQVDQNTSEPII